MRTLVVCGVFGVFLALPCTKLVGAEEFQIVPVKPQPLRSVRVAQPQKQAAKKKKKTKKNKVYPERIRVQPLEDSESEEVEVDEERVEEQVKKASWASEHCECCTLICLGKVCVGCVSFLFSVA